MGRTEKVVLIAGGAGSIGSALAERLASAGSEDIILLDKDENNLEATRQRLDEKGYARITPLVCDVRNLVHVNKICSRIQPDIILNCCAHKHVVSSQRNVSETVHNNLLTTQNLLKARHCNKDSRFIQISTDKAVEPSSVMGASKMLCESMVRTEYPQTQDRNYIIRFGNVKDTNGSVFQVWDRQFREGVPLTVTDLKMKRWMMPISDACDQILRVLGFDAGTYLLDMGPMYTVADMLERFAESKGTDAGCLQVSYVGAKPGEKDEEKLLWDVESRKDRCVGGRTLIQASNHPNFKYDRALTISSNFDDQLTLDCLQRMFPDVMA